MNWIGFAVVFHMYRISAWLSSAGSQPTITYLSLVVLDLHTEMFAPLSIQWHHLFSTEIHFSISTVNCILPRNKRVNEKIAEFIKLNKLIRTSCAHRSGAKSNCFEKLSDGGVWWFCRADIEERKPLWSERLLMLHRFNWDLIPGGSLTSAAGNCCYLWVDEIPDAVTEYMSLASPPPNWHLRGKLMGS